MIFMVIESFPDADPGPAYDRLKAQGRGLPDGVRFIEAGSRSVSVAVSS